MLHLFSVVGWQSSHVDALLSEDDGVSFHVNLALNIPFHDEFRSLLENRSFLKSKLVLDGLDTKRVVLVLALEEVNFEGNFFDLLLQHFLQGSFLELRHFVEDLDLANVGEAILPLALAQVS